MVLKSAARRRLLPRRKERYNFSFYIWNNWYGVFSASSSITDLPYFSWSQLFSIKIGLFEECVHFEIYLAIKMFLVPCLGGWGCCPRRGEEEQPCYKEIRKAPTGPQDWCSHRGTIWRRSSFGINFISSWPVWTLWWVCIFYHKLSALLSIIYFLRWFVKTSIWFSHSKKI